MSAVAKARKEYNKCVEKNKNNLGKCRGKMAAMQKAARDDATKKSQAAGQLARKNKTKIGTKKFNKAKKLKDKQNAAATKIQALRRGKRVRTEIKKGKSLYDCIAKGGDPEKCAQNGGKQGYRFHPVYGYLRY